MGRTEYNVSIYLYTYVLQGNPFTEPYSITSRYDSLHLVLAVWGCPFISLACSRLQHFGRLAQSILDDKTRP